MGQLFAAEGLKRSDIKAICEVADYDAKVIKSAKDLLSTAKNVENITGWIISCIRDGYESTGRTSGRQGGEMSKLFFGSFEQRDISEATVKDIESALLNQD